LTPHWTVRRLLEALPLPGGFWFEPCAGEGDIIKAVNEVRDDVRWCAHELRGECAPTLASIKHVEHVEIGDLLTRPVATLPKASVCISNPPFSIAQPILEHLLHGDFEHLIFLQRVNWCAGPRAALFRELRPSLYVLPDRPSFTGGSTDSTEYGFWHFDGEGKLRILNNTPLRERQGKCESDSTTPAKASLRSSRSPHEPKTAAVPTR
jgi:hypothetical protein